MRSSFTIIALAALVAFPYAAGAQSLGIDSSPRPVMRPGSLAASQSAPMARPEIKPAEAPEQVVQVQNSGFDRWIAGFRGRALSQGISPRVFDAAFQGARFDADVIAKDRNQSEFKKQIWDYLDSAASPERVKNGQAALRKHARLLKQIEATYGVDKEVVVAVWGMESRYGEHRGDVPTISALATLAYDGRRGSFFEKQLIAALQIIQQGNVAPRNMTGSWAGAMGHTQFIPTSFLAYAVDFTGDGRRDIWSDNPADALASTAAYLSRHGWRKGQPWGVEVILPRGFNTGQASKKIVRSPSEWNAMGVRGIDGRPVPNYGKGSILLPAGSAGAAFMTFSNFGVIARYNNADAYVIGVGHLSDRLRGGPPIQASWPRGYVPLDFEGRKEMQRLLTRKGFLNDKIDGLIGPNTVNAIKAYQASRGVAADGYPSQDLMKLLKGG